MASPSALSLLYLGASQPDLMGQLRESFPGVSLFSAATADELRTALATHKPTVVLCDLNAAEFELEQVAKGIRELKSPTRLLALNRLDASPDVVQVMARGARDLVGTRDHLHLRLVVARELGILAHWSKRNTQELQARVNREPLAYLSEEELEWCNEAFARLLERSAPAQIARRAFWLCIDGNDQYPLRRALQQCRSRPGSVHSVVVRVLAPDGKHILVRLGVSAIRLGGRALIRIEGRHAEPEAAASARFAAPAAPLDMEVLKRLRSAISANGLAMAVQPISGLATPVASEASRLDVLIRIKDKAGELEAAEFMREAGAAGLLKTLDHWVIINACALSARNAAFRESTFFLRISRQALQDATTPRLTCDALANYGLQPAQLSFELPETEFASLPKEEAMAYFALKKIGCRLTLSHFGSRADSLVLLQRLPLDYIKLDTELTSDVVASGDRRKLLREVVARASARQIGTISTRVSDATTLAELWKLGVHFVQGYYVQEPEIVVGK